MLAVILAHICFVIRVQHRTVVTFRAKEQVLVPLDNDEGGLLLVLGQEDAVVRQHSRQLGGESLLEVTSKERTSLSNDIDPPVNIMLEPKQETTVFMLAETYKLLILRIMTTKVKSMENIYPPAHVKGYQPTEAFEEKKQNV